MGNILIPQEHYEQLARGYGGPDAVRHLQNAERTIRLTQIRGILARDALGAAWQVFASNEPPANELLESPMFGAWLDKIMTARETQPADAVHHLAEHMGNYAIAAAYLNGNSAELEVPTHSGRVVLPNLGRTALLGDGPAHVVAYSDGDDGGLFISHAGSGKHLALNAEQIQNGSPQWENARFLHTSGGTPILLDDLDPHRNIFKYPVPATRQNSAEYEIWAAMFPQAVDLLDAAHPRFAEGLHAGLRSIIPAGTAPLTKGRSMSHGAAFGATAITTPHSPDSLASHIANGFLKNKLLTMRILSNRICRSRDDPMATEIMQVPSRESPGVASYLLDDAYINHGIAAFFNSHRLHTGDPGMLAYTEMSVARWHDEAQRSVNMLLESGFLLPDGEYMVQQLQKELSTLAEAVQDFPQEAKSAARLSAIDANINFRIHSLAPDSQAIWQLREVWRQTPRRAWQKINVPVAMVPSPETYTHTGRRSRWVLSGARHTEPDAFRAMLRGNVDANKFGKIQAGDLEFANGDIRAARNTYRARIQRNPNDKQAWAGFALTYHNSTEPASAIFMNRPEVVTELYASLGDTSIAPQEMAEWLAQHIII